MIRFDRFTQSAQDVPLRAAEIMQRYNHHYMDTEHVLLALTEQPQGIISQLLEFLNVDTNALSAGLDHLLRTSPMGDPADVGAGQIPITPRVVQVLALADEESNRLTDELISMEHLFLGILRESDTPVARLLEDVALTRDRVYDAIQQLRR